MNTKEYYRLWRVKNRERLKKLIPINYYKYHKKNLCRARIYSAIKRGRIIKPKKCEECTKYLYVQAHHEDYDRPFAVQWLCRVCHRKADKDRKNRLKNNLPLKIIKDVIFVQKMKKDLLKIKSYRISVEQDKAVRKRAKKSKVTESAIIRNLIDNANQTCPNHTKK